MSTTTTQKRFLDRVKENSFFVSLFSLFAIAIILAATIVLIVFGFGTGIQTIQGTPGIQGPEGKPGPKGPTGDTGDEGQRGLVGNQNGPLREWQTSYNLLPSASQGTFALDFPLKDFFAKTPDLVAGSFIVFGSQSNVGALSTMSVDQATLNAQPNAFQVNLTRRDSAQAWPASSTRPFYMFFAFTL